MKYEDFMSKIEEIEKGYNSILDETIDNSHLSNTDEYSTGCYPWNSKLGCENYGSESDMYCINCNNKKKSPWHKCENCGYL